MTKQIVAFQDFAKAPTMRDTSLSRLQTGYGRLILPLTLDPKIQTYRPDSEERTRIMNILTRERPEKYLA
jgi:hypothetical protein